MYIFITWKAQANSMSSVIYITKMIFCSCKVFALTCTTFCASRHEHCSILFVYKAFVREQYEMSNFYECIEQQEENK